MRRVVVVATGGTIASQKNEAGTATAGISGHHLVAAISLPRGVTVEVEQLFLLNSYNLSIADMEVLARRLQSILYDPGVDGVVVTHGTDTMEESAFLRSLFLGSEKPVVFTGAQRTPEQSGADGLRNVQDAITVAADEACRDFGTIIVFDGTLWPAGRTRKTRTLATAAFDSESGPLGVIDQGAITIFREPTPNSRFDLGQFAPVRVDIVPSYPGVDAAALDAVVKAGTAGLVVEGMGVGNVGHVLAGRVTTLMKQGMPVILTSRVPAGLVAGTYGDGGGADLVAAGAVLGGRYRSPQLRILMAVALGSSGSTQAALASLNDFLSPR
jgi:L-asparaginase